MTVPWYRIPGVAVLFLWSTQTLITAQTEAPTIDHLVNQYKAQIELLNRPLAQLETQYREALVRSLKAIQAAGDLDGVVAYTAEIERLQSNSRPPLELSEVSSLAKLQSVFRTNYQAKNTQIEESRAKVKEMTLDRMNEVLEKLTRESKIDEAVIVQESIKDFRESGVIAGPPFFKERISEDLFWERFERAKERLNIVEVKSSPPGASGVLIDGVISGGSAERIGIEVGDRILKVGDQELWSQLRLNWNHDAPERTVVWQSPDGTVKSAPVPSGALGVNFEGDNILHGIWFERGHPDPRWDDLLLISLLVAETDPEMAETALHHAVRLGYRLDAVTSAAGITLALRGGRIEEAQVYADHLISTVGGNAASLPPSLYPIYFRARFAAGRLDLLYEAEKSTAFVLGGIDEEKWGTLLTYWREVRPEWHPRDRPSLRVEALPSEDVFSRRRLTEDEKVVSNVNVEIHRTARGGDAYAVSPGMVINSYHTVDGGIDNFIWDTEIKLEPSPNPGEHQYPSELTLSVPYRDEDGNVRTAAMMHLGMNPAERTRIAVGGGGEVLLWAYLPVNWKQALDSNVARVRIIRVDNEIEILINDVTQCWMPLVGSMQEPGFRTGVMGMRAAFRDGQLLKLP